MHREVSSQGTISVVGVRDYAPLSRVNSAEVGEIPLRLHVSRGSSVSSTAGTTMGVRESKAYWGMPITEFLNSF